MSNRYRHPRSGLWGLGVAALANHAPLHRLRRALFSRLPLPPLESDVRDVVYLTSWVRDESVAEFVPDGVRLWQRDGLTPFTILTYAHGHLGPSALGPLRRVCGSPLQSNGRLYDEVPGRVLFVRNTLSSPLYTLGARLFSDVLPAHLAASFVHARDGDTLRTEIRAGVGSAPELSCVARVSQKSLPPEFAARFGGWDDAVAYLTQQDSAVVPVEALGRCAVSTIDIPIDPASVVPLAPETLNCPLVDALNPVGAPLCFLVPSLRFRALSERLAS